MVGGLAGYLVVHIRCTLDTNQRSCKFFLDASGAVPAVVQPGTAPPALEESAGSGVAPATGPVRGLSMNQAHVRTYQSSRLFF